MRFVKLVIFFSLLLSSISGHSQVKHAGKDFWITLGGVTIAPWGTPPSYRLSSNNGIISLASKHRANVQLFFTKTGQTRTYTVQPGIITEVFLDTPTCLTISNSQMEQIENRSLHITSDSPIVVHYIDDDIYRQDGTIIYPTDNQKKADVFYLQTLDRWYLRTPTAPGGEMGQPFSMVATCDSVELEITPSVQTFSHPANVPYKIRLNKGETYLMNNAVGAGNTLNGTKIRITAQCCDNPLNVFYACPLSLIVDACNLNLSSGGFSDMLLEQIQPASWWEREYPVVSWFLNGYTYKRTPAPVHIFSPFGNNPIYFDNKLIRTLQKEESFDTLIAEGVMVQGYKAIAVTQGKFAHCEHSDLNGPQDSGDPDFMWTFPANGGTKDTYFKTVMVKVPRGNSFRGDFFMTIISEKSNVASIRLNGNNISSYFKNFLVNPKWQYAYIPLDTGATYHLTADAKVIGYVYFETLQGGYTYTLADMDESDIYTTGNNTLDSVYKCMGKSIMLLADTADKYEWNTGATVANLSVVDTGYYWVKEINEYDCGNTYKLHHFYVKDMDTATMKYAGRIDTLYKCNTADLIADTADSYVWNTGQTSRQISVNAAGYYWVNQYRNVTECQQSIIPHVFLVRDKDFGITIDIGNDTTICKGRYFALNSGIEASQWSNGTTGSSITVTAAGMYKASVTDSCGRLYSDSVWVYVRDCGKDAPCQIAFPSAFTPNADGRNDVYRPVTWGSFSDYHLLIYNRWGELMFDSYDFKGSWDGRHKNEDMPGGVYMYICTVTCGSRNEVFKGDITLIR